MRAVGDNPAEMLATTFMSHRDVDTLAWSDTPFFTIPAVTDAPSGFVDLRQGAPVVAHVEEGGPVLQRHGARRPSDGSEMLAGSLCIDTIDQANAIDAHFNDVNAFIRSVKPPAYPFAIDRQLASQGHDVFVGACSGCHGTYAPDRVLYPDLVIPHETILTDDAESLGGTSQYYGAQEVDWYNKSWYGQLGHYAPQNG